MRTMKKVIRGTGKKGILCMENFGNDLTIGRSYVCIQIDQLSSAQPSPLYVCVCLTERGRERRWMWPGNIINRREKWVVAADEWSCALLIRRMKRTTKTTINSYTRVKSRYIGLKSILFKVFSEFVIRTVIVQ